MRTRAKASRILIGITLLMGATVTHAAAITFHPERGIIGGNGCSAESSSIKVNEFGELEIHYDNMMIAMSPQTSLMADRRSCSVRIPISIPHGYYIESLEQRLAYGVSKSADTIVSVATRLSLAGLQVSPYTVTIPYGDEFHSDYVLDTRRDFIGTDAHIRTQCRDDQPTDTMLQLNTVISGQRQSAYDELYVTSNDSYIAEGYEIELAPCP